MNEYPIIICVLFGGPDRTIRVNGQDWRFEMHPRMGPVPKNKNGTQRMTQWPRSVQWAVDLWAHQGEATEGGECVWDDSEGEIAALGSAERQGKT